MLKTLWLSILFLITLHGTQTTHAGNPEEEHGVKYADNCEACKILAIELDDRLKHTGKSHDVIDLGYSVDDVKPKKKIEYRKSELRLEESKENLCEQVLQYNVHKERKDSTRFAKGMSQTFEALHGLVNKGVKVELGIPYELWDNPSAEITKLKSQCETLLEEYEDEISEWYFGNQDQPLIDHLCRDRVLKGRNSQCLYEEFKPEDKKKELEGESEKPKKKKNKNKSKKKSENTKGDAQDDTASPKEEL